MIHSADDDTDDGDDTDGDDARDGTTTGANGRIGGKPGRTPDGVGGEHRTKSSDGRGEGEGEAGRQLRDVVGRERRARTRD